MGGASVGGSEMSGSPMGGTTAGAGRTRRRAALAGPLALLLGLLLTSCVVGQKDLGAADHLDPNVHFDRSAAFAMVPYGPDPQQHLDVYLPDGDVRGTLIWFHAGGWATGDQVAIDALIGTFVDRGYALVAADYRFAPQFRAPELAADADRVVRFVKVHRGEWGAPTGPVVLTGGSAGGNLALLAAAAPGVFAGDLPEELRAQSPQVDGVISFVGPSDLPAYLTGGVLGAALVEDFLGCHGVDSTHTELPPCEPGRAALYSPLVWASFAAMVHATLPPAFLSCGELDDLVPPPVQCTPLALDWQRSAGAPWTWYSVVSGEGHNLTYGVNSTDLHAWMELVTARD